MRRIVINLLAVVGGATLLSTLAGFVLHRYEDKGATGIVLGPDRKPAVGVPVFLDRGTASIERYLTDSLGQFSLPVEAPELYRSRWLICVPGGIPMVAYANQDRNKLGSTTYEFARYVPGTPTFIRAHGWLGPMPRECPPATDSVGWRYPPSSGKDPHAWSPTEPDWNQY
jgi:hypothetical protein